MSEATNEDQEEQEISVEYEESDQHTTFHASGIRGGIQPRGDLRIEFYTEAAGTPEGEYYTMDEEGRLNGTHHESDPPIVRERQAAAYMSPETGVNMAAWILSVVANVSIEQASTVIQEEFEDLTRDQQLAE